MTEETMRAGMRNRLLALGLAIAGLMAAPALAQTDFEAVLAGPDGSSLAVSARLAEGWRIDTYPGGVSFSHPDDGGREVTVVLGNRARDRLGGRSGWDGARIVARRGTLGGLSATLYSGSSDHYGTPAQFLDNRFLRGSVVLAHLDGCQGPSAAPAVVRFLSAQGFASLSEDTELAALVEGLTLTLPEGVEPCPPDLAAALQAVSEDLASDGWIRHERFGLAFWLPADFLVLEDHPTGFFATHPDHDDPDGPGLFSVQLTWETARDAWRQDTADDATLTVHPRRDLGATGTFDATTAVFQDDGYSIHGTVMVAEDPNPDGYYLQIGVATVGRDAQEPWLGLRDLHDQIVARLGAP